MLNDFRNNLANIYGKWQKFNKNLQTALFIE